MKLTFEGPSLEAIFDDMERILSRRSKVFEKPKTAVPDHPPIQRFSELPIVPKAIVQKDKPQRARTEKQLANDAKLRERAKLRPFGRKPASIEPEMAAPPPPPPPPPENMDPAEMVKLRTKTIEELQTAYANGHHKEVLELLSRFGDGATSFRELPPEAFPEIRRAIDLGALT